MRLLGVPHTAKYPDIIRVLSRSAGHVFSLSLASTQVYQQMRHYYGPQYDIQTGVHHQGYGDEDNYDGFWGKGSLYIDLPRSRVYDASFNCTPGFQARCVLLLPLSYSWGYLLPSSHPHGYPTLSLTLFFCFSLSRALSCPPPRPLPLLTRVRVYVHSAALLVDEQRECNRHHR